MERSERLLDLLAGLVDARRPVPFSEIQEWFPDDYARPAKEAALRKFERDKEDLLELGVPLRWVDPDDDGEGGYLVERERLYLPPLRLSPDETATVYLAGLALLGSPGFPYRGPLATALRKIELTSDAQAHGEASVGRRVYVGAPVPDGDEALEERVEELGSALRARKQVTLTYRAASTGDTTRRDVDPYGLYCRGGQWHLVGYCHLRTTIRTFLVRRIFELTVNQRRPGTPDFQVPEDFRLRDWVAIAPWRYEVHTPIVVELEVDAELAWLVDRHLGVAATLPPPGASALDPQVKNVGAGARFAVEVSNLDALVGWVMGLGPRVRVVAPAAACEAVERAARGLLARHRSA